jgi:membrane protease YdiL (CAAX protease family)
MRRPRSAALWFFVLAYAITGVGMWVNSLAFRRLPPGTPINSRTVPWLPYVPYVLWAGPCLAGLLMTLLLHGLAGVRRLASRLSPWSVGGAWLVLAVCLLPVVVPPSFLVLASLIGLLMVLGLRGRAGTRRVGSQLRDWLLGQGWPALAVCLLLPLGVEVLAVGVLAGLGVAVPAMSWGGWPRYLHGAVIAEGLIGPGLFEEIGWRGFALPQLQRRYSALVSGLIIGPVWAFWHFPNFPAATPSMLAVFIPKLMALSLIFTWACNSTQGSLLAVVLLHGAINASAQLFDSPDAGVALRTDAVAGLLYAAIAAGLVWRYGAANLSRRDRVVAEPPGDGRRNDRR